jgi:lipoate-protein ligase B
LLWDTAELERRGIRVVWTDRGGDVTYHGPGQLVGYPLLQLGRPGQSEPAGRIPQADYVGYLRRLEETLIRALAASGVPAHRRDGLTGVWARRELSEEWGKVAAIGVKVDAQGVTRHGFALNVNPVMSHWEGIIACGLVDEHPASLAELLANPPSMPQVAQAVAQAFGAVFGFAMRWITAGESLKNQDSV